MKKINWKRSAVVELYNNLNGLGHLTGVKFSYGIVRNINILKSEVDALQASIKMSEEYTAYDKKRVVIVKEFAKKDEKDEYVMKGISHVISDQKGFDVAIKKFQKPYKELLSTRDKQVEEYNKLLKEDIELELFLIDMEDMPEEITTQEMNNIFEIIKEK